MDSSWAGRSQVAWAAVFELLAVCLYVCTSVCAQERVHVQIYAVPAHVSL